MLQEAVLLLYCWINFKKTHLVAAKLLTTMHPTQAYQLTWCLTEEKILYGYFTYGQTVWLKKISKRKRSFRFIFFLIYLFIYSLFITFLLYLFLVKVFCPILVSTIVLGKSHWQNSGFGTTVLKTRTPLSVSGSSGSGKLRCLSAVPQGRIVFQVLVPWRASSNDEAPKSCCSRKIFDSCHYPYSCIQRQLHSFSTKFSKPYSCVSNSSQSFFCNQR